MLGIKRNAKMAMTNNDFVIEQVKICDALGINVSELSQKRIMNLNFFFQRSEHNLEVISKKL